MPGTAISVFAVNPHRIGGVEMFARELSGQLDSLGWKSVLCFSAEPPPAVRRFLDLPNVSIETIPGSRGTSWKSVREMSALISKYKADVLHMYFTQHIAPWPWLARLHSVHSNFFTDQISRSEFFTPRPSAFWKRIVGNAVNAPLTNVISVGDYNARVMQSSGVVDKDRVRRIYNGVDLTRVSGDPLLFRKKHNIPAGKPIVLHISSMIPEKGMEDLLEAAKIVLASNPHVQFVLAGEGGDKARYVDIANRAGLAGSITWTGLVEDPIAEGIYSAANVVCHLPTWQEAFGWTNAEAMACGRPVIATRVGAVPEIIEDGVSGYLVGPRQPAQAAARILEVLADETLAARLGAAARRTIETRFDLRSTVAELVGLYPIPDGDKLRLPKMVHPIRESITIEH